MLPGHNIVATLNVAKKEILRSVALPQNDTQ